MSTKIIINKFGGEIMGTAELMSRAVGIVKKQIQKGCTPINVVSACAGITDELALAIEEALSKRKYKKRVVTDFIKTIRNKHFELIQKLKLKRNNKLEEKINQIIDELSSHLYTLCQFGEIKVVLGSFLSYGEKLSSLILVEKLKQEGVTAQQFTADHIGIITDDNYTDADILYNEAKISVRKNFKFNKTVPVVCGFCGKTKNGRISVLGRGGSDTTACFLGNVFKADRIYLWKTVDGVLSADPRIVKNAKTIKCLSYYEASESGKVIHDKAMKYALLANIEVIVANINNPNKYTVIKKSKDKNKKVKMVTYRKDQVFFEIRSGHMSQSGFLYKITEIFAKYKINMNLIRNTHEAFYIVVDNHNPDIKKIIDELTKMGHYLKVRPCVMVSIIGTLGWQLTHQFNVLLKDMVRIVRIGAFPYKYCTRLEAIVSPEGMTRVVKRLHAKFIGGR